MDLQWYDFLRMLTATIALASLYLLARTSRVRWRLYTRRIRELSWVLQGWLVLAIEGSIEQIITDVPFGSRNMLSFIIVCVCFRATLRNEGFLKDDN